MVELIESSAVDSQVENQDQQTRARFGRIQNSRALPSKLHECLDEICGVVHQFVKVDNVACAVGQPKLKKIPTTTKDLRSTTHEVCAMCSKLHSQLKKLTAEGQKLKEQANMYKADNKTLRKANNGFEIDNQDLSDKVEDYEAKFNRGKQEIVNLELSLQRAKDKISECAMFGTDNCQSCAKLKSDVARLQVTCGNFKKMFLDCSAASAKMQHNIVEGAIEVQQQEFQSMASTADDILQINY